MEAIYVANGGMHCWHTKAVFELGEIRFQKSFSIKPTCLAVTENDIFRKMTSGWLIFSPLTRKWFSPLIFTSNHVRKKRERERERERERSRRIEIAIDSAISRTTMFVRSRRRSRSRERRDRAGEITISDRDRWWFFSGLWLVFFWICVFLLLFQTPENIFRKIFWNATKHMEKFSFSGN